MSKLKLAFSPKHSYVLDVAPLAGVFRGRFALLQRILTLLALTYIVLSTLLLGVVILGYSTLDSALLAALLNSVIVLTAVWLGLMLLCGWSYVVDPPLFVPVLVFALLVTVTYLLSPGLTGQAGNPANTFGVVGTKMISVAGLSASIFLYYFVNAFVNTESRLRILFSVLIWGILLLTVRFITLPAAAELEVSKYLLMVTPTLFFFLLLARQKSLGFWATVITIILSFHVILAAPLSMWVWIMSAVIGVAILVVLIMMTEFSVTDSLNSLRADIAKTLSSQISVAKVFQNNPVLSLIILFIAYLVLMTIVFVQGKLVFATEIADLAKDYQAAFAGITDVRTLLFGGGAVSNRVVVGLADIIAYNGLVGLVAYLLLWGSVIRFALERMLAGISEKTPQYEALILLPILLGLPLLAIFTAVPALGWWMWWISVAYLAADLLHDKRKVKQELLPTWKWRQNIKILAPIIQIIGILVIIITASALTRVITELFTQTTI